MIYKKLTFITAQALVICVLGLPAFCLAQVKPISFTKNQMLTLKPLIKYLRCEADVLDEFGRSSPPNLSQLFLILENANLKEKAPFNLEVWPGTLSEIKAEAGYGFFIMLQRYPIASKDILLKAMRADGWQFERSAMPTAQQVQNSTIINEMVAVHSATRPIAGQPGRTRTLTVTEANQSMVPGEIDLDNITVFCRYSPVVKAEGKK